MCVCEVGEKDGAGERAAGLLEKLLGLSWAILL